MSTAVTAFYDVRDVLLQNQKNIDRRLAECNARTLEELDKYETAAAMLSKLQRSHQLQLLHLKGSPVLGNREILLSGRRLDRSISEPVGCDPKRMALSAQAQAQQQQNARGMTASSRYKTELCRPFEENGYCKYGDKCQFAHGSHELRSLARHPKYKTELCRTFHTIGFCPYGPRCHFIHNEDERKLSQINHLKVQGGSGSSSPNSALSSSPTQMQQQPQRPRALNFTLQLVRESLGSTADSPPSSITSDSPQSMSPTWLSGSEDFMQQPGSLRYSPPASAPANMPAFTFPADSPMAPLNVDTFASLTAGLHALSLNNCSSASSTTSSGSSTSSEAGFPTIRDALGGGDVFCPPSPPNSLGSDCPLDIARGIRLPIFHQISHE